MLKRLHSFILMLLAISTASCGGQTSQDITVNASDQHADRTPMPSPTVSSAGETPSPTPSHTIEGSHDSHETAGVIRQYYEAINGRQYRQAFELWSDKGKASKQTFDDFRNGFAETDEANAVIDEKHISVEGAAGSQYAKVPVTISARMSDGRQQNYRGKYVLRRSMVDGATAEQRAWRIYSADIEKAP